MPAEPRVAPRLRPLVERDLDAALILLNDGFDRPWSRAQLRGELDRSSWALELADSLVGVACLAPLPPEVEILTIAVDRACRRRGLGAWLLSRALERAAADGCRTAFLEVRPSNVAALALYRRCGFAEIGRRRGYYDGGREDAIVLSARIAGGGAGRV